VIPLTKKADVYSIFCEISVQTVTAHFAKQLCALYLLALPLPFDIVERLDRSDDFGTAVLFFFLRREQCQS